MRPPGTARIALFGRFDEPDIDTVLAWRVLERELAARLPGMRVESYAPVGSERPMPLDDGRPATPLGELQQGEPPDVVILCDASLLCPAGTVITLPAGLALGALAPGLFDERVLEQRAAYLRITGVLGPGPVSVGSADAEAKPHGLGSESPLIDQIAAVRAAESVLTESPAIAEAAESFGTSWSSSGQATPRPGDARLALDALAAEIASRVPRGPHKDEDASPALAAAQLECVRLSNLYEGALARAGLAALGHGVGAGPLQDVTVLRAELLRVYSSRSWRWLAPLRALNGYLRKLRGR